MVLGDQAYDRGAWANRIGESEPGVGYLFGEGVREPLRVRAGWVPDETIKQLEDFVTGTAPAAPGTPGRCLPCPRPRHPPAVRPEVPHEHASTTTEARPTTSTAGRRTVRHGVGGSGPAHPRAEGPARPVRRRRRAARRGPRRLRPAAGDAPARPHLRPGRRRPRALRLPLGGPLPAVRGQEPPAADDPVPRGLAPRPRTHARRRRSRPSGRRS